RHRHQPSADRVFTNNREHSLVQFLVLRLQSCARRKHRLSNAPQRGLTCNQFPNPRFKRLARHLTDLEAEAAQDFPECSIPRPTTFREAACAHPAALGSPAIQSIWRAPAGTIPSAADGQAHTHPCGPSSPSSPTMPPSHAASPAKRFEILLASARHAAIVITAP